MVGARSSEEKRGLRISRPLWLSGFTQLSSFCSSGFVGFLRLFLGGELLLPARGGSDGGTSDDSPRISSLHVLNSRLTQHPRPSVERAGVAVRWAHLLSVVGCMDKLTEDAVQEIEQIHSSWIEFEIAGDDQSMLALCADDIELWPPDAQPLLGRAAVSAQMAHATTTIYSIEITHRRVRGSNELLSLAISL